MTHARPSVLALTAGLSIGVLVAVQARINGAFAVELQDPVVAAALGFVFGWLALTVVMLSGAQHRNAVRALPGLVRGRALPWWTLIGGLGGATLVATQGLAVPELGVALFIVALVAGQTASSLEVDRLGLGPRGVMQPSRARVVSAVIALVAVVIAVEPWSTGASDLSVFVLLMCLFAGTAVSAQQAFNGRVAQSSGSPIAAAWVNFSVGGIMLWTLALMRGVDLTLAPSPIEQPWLWTGGLMGSVFVVVAAAIVRTLGVLLLTLTTIAGQLFGAVIIDVVAPTPGRPITAFSLIGVALTFVAVLVGSGLLRRRAAPLTSTSE